MLASQDLMHTVRLPLSTRVGLCGRRNLLHLPKKSSGEPDSSSPTKKQEDKEEDEAIKMDFEEEHDEEMEEEGDLVDLDKYARRMHRAVEIFGSSVQKIRGATPSTSMLDHVHIDAYGESMVLPQVAQTSLKGATLMVVTPFDPSLCKAIEKAIRDANLGLNPSSDEQIVKVPLPKVTKETREARAKQVNEMAEATRRRVRKIRQRMMDRIKKQTGHGVSEDDVHSQTKQGQAEVDKVMEQIQKISKKKQDELLNH
eukprot:gb/GECG01000656.1/.p1 GENE.gb/GECG01000656.1/~~gb/GECG01000656.1/.p1  ORF type:complete len:256 (+),score=51.27 gb/GECG01000656.1/:1-768(+)